MKAAPRNRSSGILRKILRHSFAAKAGDCKDFGAFVSCSGEDFLRKPRLPNNVAPT